MYKKLKTTISRVWNQHQCRLVISGVMEQLIGQFRCSAWPAAWWRSRDSVTADTRLLRLPDTYPLPETHKHMKTVLFCFTEGQFTPVSVDLRPSSPWWQISVYRSASRQWRRRVTGWGRWWRCIPDRSNPAHIKSEIMDQSCGDLLHVNQKHWQKLRLTFTAISSFSNVPL